MTDELRLTLDCVIIKSKLWSRQSLGDHLASLKIWWWWWTVSPNKKN